MLRYHFLENFDQRVSVHCSWSEVNGLSIDDIVKLCQDIPQVRALNPESDHNQYYFSIDCSYSSITITFSSLT